MTQQTERNSAAAGSAQLIIERTYRAEPRELWELWTTKEGFESWWGPEGFRVDVHELEARVGGPLFYDMIADAPEQVAEMKAMGAPISHETRGKFSALEPFDRLAVTHVIDFLPGVTPFENTIVVEFFKKGPDVRMVVTLEAMHTEEFSQMQREGFTSQLRKLDKRYGIV